MKQLYEISHNQRIKEYPDGHLEILTASRPIFREPGWELADKWQPDHRQRAAGDPKPENIRRAVRRAKIQLRDLALCNEMRYFVTLTLDQAVVDRYDMVEITKRLNTWCSNQVQRHGLAYVLVPERHQDGAVHFHGFVNDAVRVVDSGTLSVPGKKKPRRPADGAQRQEWLAAGAHVVYNLPDWPLGFTSAIALYGDPVAAVGYCCKYIGKDLSPEGHPQKIGGRWFYHGGCHEKPTVRYADVDFDSMPITGQGVYAWDVMEAGCTFIRETVSL